MKRSASKPRRTRAASTTTTPSRVQSIAEVLGGVLLVVGIGALGLVIAGPVLAVALGCLLAGSILVLVGNV